MKVFVRYSRKDSFIADHIEAWLHDGGFEPLRDTSTFRAGGSFPQTVDDMLDKCDIVVALLSDSFYDSRSGWTEYELGHARAWGKKILFVATDHVGPRGAFRDEKPLELGKLAPNLQPGYLVTAIQDKLGLSGRPVPGEDLDRWCSRHFMHSNVIKESARAENIAYSRLHVASTMELAAKVTGWQPHQVVTKDIGDSQNEEDVAVSLAPVAWRSTCLILTIMRPRRSEKTFLTNLGST